MNAKPFIFSPEQIQYLKDNFKSMTNQELADAIGTTKRVIGNKATKLGLKGKTHGKTGHYPKDHEPWNKDLKGLWLSHRNQFAKGHLPHNTRPMSDIRVKLDKRSGLSYKEIKVAHGKWVGLNRYIWEHNHGEIPPKHVVIFKDGDQLNCVIENLDCISMSQNSRRNCDYKKMSETRITGSKEARLIDNDGYVANRITTDMSIKKDVLKNKDLLELKRKQIRLQRAVLNEKKMLK